jgi:hypothetical protein
MQYVFARCIHYIPLNHLNMQQTVFPMKASWNKFHNNFTPAIKTDIVMRKLFTYSMFHVQTPFPWTIYNILFIYSLIYSPKTFSHTKNVYL